MVLEIAFNNHSAIGNGQVTKKHGHRGRGKNKNLKVYLNNVNGLVCRADSVKDILETEKPDIVVLCETKASNSFVANFFENVSHVPVIKSRFPQIMVEL